MNTENQTEKTISGEQMELIDAIMGRTERACCVLELVSDAMQSSDLLPALRVAIDQIEDINRTINAWSAGETIKV